jgi:hypothetical protein
MNKHTIAAVVVAILILSPDVLAGDEQGGSAGSFLEWGAGSKAIAMGKTFSGVADDGTALFWNPAGLAQIPKGEIVLMHALVFEDRQQNFFSLAYPFSPVTLSLGWMRFGVTGIQERDAQGQLVGQFSDAENLFLLGAGMTVLDEGGLSVRAGLAGRYFYHSLYNYHGSGWGFDMGGMLNYGLAGVVKRVGVAAVVQNVGASVKWNTESGHKDDVPLAVRLGAIAEASVIPLLVAIDVEKKDEQDLRVHAGGEYTWQILSLRLGVNNTTFTAGAGVIVNLDFLEIGVDYAYTTDEISDKALHFFTLRGRF